MKRLILVSAVLLGCLCARADPLDNALNGATWKRLNHFEKVMYIHGAHDALLLAPVLVLAHNVARRGPELGERIDGLDEINLEGMSYAEVVAALDGFYANPVNVRIPILAAFQWVRLRGAGEREAEAATLRAKWPKDGKSK